MMLYFINSLTLRGYGGGMRRSTLWRGALPLPGFNTGIPAQLHFIQRSGGSINQHIHVHAVVSDGVFTLKKNIIGREEVVFTPVTCPNAGQLADIVTAVRKKFIRRISRTGALSREDNS